MEQIRDTIKDSNQANQTNSSALDWQYIVLKIEKLTAALHLVTSFLNNTDPIKYKLRDQSLITLQAGLNFKYGNSIYKTAGIDDLKRAIDTLTSFIAVALTDSSVSQMNLTILQKEYRDLYNYLDRYQVNQENLVGKIEAPRVNLAPLTTNQPYHLKSATFHPHNSDAKAHQSSHKIAQPSLQTSVNKERRDLIVGYVTEHSWSAINEIAKIVPGVSDKTVQRELAALVNEGVLLKKGDRRWSRYSRAS